MAGLPSKVFHQSSISPDQPARPISQEQHGMSHMAYMKYGPDDGLIWHIYGIWYIWHMPQGSCGKSGHMLLVFSLQSRFFRKPILIPFILSRNIDKTFDIQLKMFAAFQITSFSKFEKAQSQLYPSSSKKQKSKKYTKYEIKRKKWKMHNLKQGSGPDHKSYTFAHFYSTVYWMHFRVFWKPWDFSHTADIASLLVGRQGGGQLPQEILL